MFTIRISFIFLRIFSQLLSLCCVFLFYCISYFHQYSYFPHHEWKWICYSNLFWINRIVLIRLSSTFGRRNIYPTFNPFSTRLYPNHICIRVTFEFSFSEINLNLLHLSNGLICPVNWVDLKCISWKDCLTIGWSDKSNLYYNKIDFKKFVLDFIERNSKI